MYSDDTDEASLDAHERSRRKKRLHQVDFRKQFKKDLYNSEVQAACSVVSLPDQQDDKPHFQVERGFNAKDAAVLLASVNKDMCSKAPPISIEPNTVFVFRITDGTKQQSWRRDLQKWKAEQSHDYPPNTAKPYVHKFTSKHCVDPSAIRTEYWPVGYSLNQFRKWRPAFVLIHYNDQCSFVKTTKKEVKAKVHSIEAQFQRKTAKRKKYIDSSDSTDFLADKESTARSPKAKTKTARRGSNVPSSSSSQVYTYEVETISDEEGHNKKEQESETNSQRPAKSHKKPSVHDDSPDTGAELSDESDGTAGVYKHSKSHPMANQAIDDLLKQGTFGVENVRKLAKNSLYLPKNERLMPKNKRAVYYRMKLQKVRQAGDVDDIASAWAFAKNYEKIVIGGHFIPYLWIVQTHPAIMHHLEEVVSVEEYVQLFYDTTYNAGHAYASLLVAKHPWFVHQPGLKLAIVFHESRHRKYSHDAFFSTLTDQYGWLKTTKKIIMIIDREPAIKRSVKEHLPNAIILFCFIHLLDNACRKGKQLGLGSKERWDIIRSIRALLWSPSEMEFDALLATLLVTSVQSETQPDLDDVAEDAKWAPNNDEDQMLQEILQKDTQNQYDPWPLKFCQYFERYMLEDVANCARFTTQHLGVFNKISGYTTNPVEAIHHQFKLDRQLSSFRINIDIFYGMQVLDLWNINGAIEGEPHDWKPTAMGRKYLRNLDEYEVEDVKIMFPELVTKTPELLALEGANLNYKRTRAINIVRSNGVEALKTNGYFAVQDIGNTVFLVNYPKNTCSCREGPKCVHITAVHVRLHGEKASSKFDFLTQSKPKVMQDVYMKTKLVKTGKKGSHLGRDDPYYGKNPDDNEVGTQSQFFASSQDTNKQNKKQGPSRTEGTGSQTSKKTKVRVPASKADVGRSNPSRGKKTTQKEDDSGTDKTEEEFSSKYNQKPVCLELEGSDDPDDPKIQAMNLDLDPLSGLAYGKRYQEEKASLGKEVPKVWPEEPDRAAAKYIGISLKTVTVASDTDSASNILTQARSSIPSAPSSDVSMLYSKELCDHLKIEDFKSLLGYAKREKRGTGSLWINDNILTAFFRQTFANCPWVYVPETGIILNALDGKKSAMTVRVLARANPLYIVTALNVGGTHWIYLEIHVRTRIVCTADSMGSFQLNKTHGGLWWENFKKLMSKVEEKLPAQPPSVTGDDQELGPSFSLRRPEVMTKEASYWKIQLLDCANQKDGHACGVFSSMFAKRRLNGEPLTTPLRQALKRVEIFRSLAKNCDLTTYICLKSIPGYPCRVCKERWDDGRDTIVCVRCGSRVHLECFRLPEDSRGSYTCEQLRE